MDKQYPFAVILILLGFGLTQVDTGEGSFLVGLGFGTVVIASVWIAIRIIKDWKKK